MAERTRAELERLLRPPLGEENALDRWRREVYQQELEHLEAREKREKEHEMEREKEREQERALTTGAYMQQWYAYFDNVIANERAAMTEQLRNLREVMIDAAGEALAEVRREIETQNKCALDIALSTVRKSIVELQRECAKQKGVIDKLLQDNAVLKRQVKMLEDAHGKSIENTVTHLGHRIAAMESAQHVVDQNAIANLERRISEATQLAAALPAWMTRGS